MIGKLSAQHRAIDFRDFLGEIDRQTAPGLAIHVICDNLSAHKAPVVQRWLLAHPRVQLHFTPTYSSWISRLMERWFAELQRRCLDRGVFCSLDELTAALEDWIKAWNATARPFTCVELALEFLPGGRAPGVPDADRLAGVPGGRRRARRQTLLPQRAGAAVAGHRPPPAPRGARGPG